MVQPCNKSCLSTCGTTRISCPNNLWFFGTGAVRNGQPVSLVPGHCDVLEHCKGMQPSSQILKAWMCYFSSPWGCYLTHQHRKHVSDESQEFSCTEGTWIQLFCVPGWCLSNSSLLSLSFCLTGFNMLLVVQKVSCAYIVLSPSPICQCSAL